MLQTYHLSQLLSSISQCLKRYYSGQYWIKAETSDFVQRANGFCYLDLVEKSPTEDRVVAKMRALIFPSETSSICSRFESLNKRPLASGMQILCLCTVTHHPVYGISLRIVDIDPSYSLGDLARKRLELIQNLKKEGLFELNKSLALARPLRRLAIISSATAAGYQDFIKQIEENSQPGSFFMALFTATMQGDSSEASVIAALERIQEHRELFDAVVIIRGGGASIDLAAFDAPQMVRACAKFPLPILTGIGHERDESVLDLIAYKALKTPSALANFICDLQRTEDEGIERLRQRAIDAIQMQMANHYRQLDLISGKLPLMLQDSLRKQERILKEQQITLKEGLTKLLQEEQNRWRYLVWRLPTAYKALHQRQLELLQRYADYLQRGPKEQQKACSRELALLEQQLAQAIEKKQLSYRSELEQLEQAVRLLHPANTLKRGYSIVRRGKEILRSAADFKKGDRISSQFHDGTVESEVI